MSERRRATAAVRFGWALTVLSTAALVMSAGLKLAREAHNVEYVVGRFGYPEAALVPIGLIELASVLLYAWPATSVLGAVLLTGYLGGAVATHIRIGEAFPTPVVLAALVWLGLYLREPRLRPLLPLRKGQ